MADPDYTIIDGFDKYSQKASAYWTSGSVGTPAFPWDKVFDGEWTPPAVGNSLTFRDPIGSARGLSLGLNGQLVKVLPASYARAVGGVCWMKPGATLMNIEFGKSGASCLTVQWNTDGNIVVRRGNGSATIIATASGAGLPLATGSTHFISWDVTPANSGGIAKVWVDGVLVLTFTGDTTSAAADGVDQIVVFGNNSSNCHDHLYCDFFSAAGGSELPFLTNPVVYTDNPDSDSAANFTVGTTILGDAECFAWATASLGSNTTNLRRVLCNASGNLTDVYFVPWVSSATAKMKAMIYADSAGNPAGLLGTSNEMTGTAARTAKQITFGTPVALTAGTYYWIAIRCDTSITVLKRGDSLTGNNGQVYTQTYTTAPLNPASGLSATDEMVCFGVITGATSRADALDVGNFATQYAYNYSATAGQEDLFTPPAIPGTPTGIHHVAIKTYSYRSDAGARTVDMRIKSGASTYSGSLTGITPNALNPNWIGSNFRKDPNGSIVWTKTNLDASKFGYKLVS